MASWAGNPSFDLFQLPEEHQELRAAIRALAEKEIAPISEEQRNLLCDPQTSGGLLIAVSAEGKATACRIVRPSKDAQANAITCALALQRFRFKPATDGQGNPVASTYGWRQRWYE